MMGNKAEGCYQKILRMAMNVEIVTKGGPMEEQLRKELKEIYMQCHHGEISKEKRSQKYRELLHGILEENPQRLIDLCVGHISGLSDVSLLEMVKNKPDDFAYMNISAGSYHYSTVKKDSPHPDSGKIKTIYREILGKLGLEKSEISKILNKTRNYDEYNSYPAETMLDVLEDEGLCASLDWKFGLEDVEYNLNFITKRLHLNPIREYPPYEEGQPLGMEALKFIIGESGYGAVVICDGDTMYVFLTFKDKVEALNDEVNRLREFWSLDEAFVML